VLRAEFHAAIKARHLTRSKVAADLGVSKGSICGWLAPNGAPPSDANSLAIQRWLSSAAKSAPETPAARDGWPALREQLRGLVREHGLTHAEIGGALGVEAATVGGWLATSHEKCSPAAPLVLRIETWLLNGAPVPAVAAAEASLYSLSPAEQQRLAAHLSLAGNEHELRDEFGCTRELLERAVTGAHLDGEIISRLRGVLANDAAG
jgi:transcriptional regulator with XRE-family HTH domain